MVLPPSGMRSKYDPNFERASLGLSFASGITKESAPNDGPDSGLSTEHEESERKVKKVYSDRTVLWRMFPFMVPYLAQTMHLPLFLV